jgi:hypothetical protein
MSSEEMQAALGRVRQSRAGGEPASELHELAARLEGLPAALARAAALLVEDRAGELARLSAADPQLTRQGPIAYAQLRRVPDGAPLLFSGWLGTLERGTHSLGTTAFRAYLGDVAEAAFRAVQLGADADALLGEGKSFLVDAASSELPGTTEFLAARGMAWLLGALARDDESARAAVEKARARFHDAAFIADCDAILGDGRWP